LMARLAELPFIDLRPDLDVSLLQGDVGQASLGRYHAVLFPVLRLCLAILASLGGDNVSAASQVLQFLTGHEETVSLILRGSAARSSLHPALLQELSLLTGVVARAASLDLHPDTMDAGSIELAGQQARLQRQMLALLTQFQLNDNLNASLASASSSPLLPVLQIISNCVSFARSLVSTSSLNSRSCKLVVSPSMVEDIGGPASSRAPSLGLLVTSARRLAKQLSVSKARLVEGKDRLAALPSLPLTELTAMAQVSPTEKMPAASIRKLAQERTASSVSTMESEVKLCTATVEGLSFLLWRHLEHFLLYTSAATTSGPGTPFQAAFNRLHSAPLEQGIVPFSPKAAFSQADLEKLKSDASLTLNEAFFGQLADAAEGGEGRAVAFLQSILRRTQRLAALHTQ